MTTGRGNERDLVKFDAIKSVESTSWLVSTHGAPLPPPSRAVCVPPPLIWTSPVLFQLLALFCSVCCTPLVHRPLLHVFFSSSTRSPFSINAVLPICPSVVPLVFCFLFPPLLLNGLLDQARALLTFMEAISEKTLRSTVALTASRSVLFLLLLHCSCVFVVVVAVYLFTAPLTCTYLYTNLQGIFADYHTATLFSCTTHLVT